MKKPGVLLLPRYAHSPQNRLENGLKNMKNSNISNLNISKNNKDIYIIILDYSRLFVYLSFYLAMKNQMSIKELRSYDTECAS